MKYEKKLHGRLVKAKEEKLQLDTHDSSDFAPSWISRTIKKPSMETISSWSLNKFTKFIEGDEPSPIPEEHASMDEPTVGPFSHYSEISSATTSQLPSPDGSVKGASLAAVGR